MMWYNIFKFEIKYRIKRPDTYVFFCFLFLFSIVGVDFIFQGVELGAVKKNSPLIIAKTIGAITGIFLILASMIMGVSVLRDFEYQIESLMFVNPIKKRDYLLGRFLGSFTVLLFVFSGVFFGMILGEFMPWHDTNDYLPLDIMVYLKSFITITLPTLFFSACLFFVSGALSRKLVVVYTQGIVLFVVFMLTKAITNPFWQAIFDPFSLTTTTFVTKSWSALEKNTQDIPFFGVLMYNKLFWFTLGILALVYGYKKFNFNVIKSKKSIGKKLFSNDTKHKEGSTIVIPSVRTQKGIPAKWIQLKNMSWFYFTSICRLPSFWAIVICSMIIILINAVNLGTVYGVDSYPTTYFIVEELQETSMYFFIIIMLFYSGELIWKERSVKLNLMYDATSASSFVNLLSKYFGLILIYIVLMTSLILSGLIFQTLNGYYNYELQVYFYGFFLETLPFLALFSMLAFFIQAIVNNKFIGIMTVLVFFITITVLSAFGFDHDLYLFGGNTLPKYSDMNGYGRFLKPYVLIKTYWFIFGLMLLIIASLCLVRGTETNFFKRLRASRSKMSSSLFKLTSILMVLFVLIGSYIFYNQNVLNTYWTTNEATQFRVDYENTLKRFEYQPQPKITDVNLQVELYPSKRDYTAEGYYILKNTNETVIKEIYIQKLIESHVTLNHVTFEGGATVNMQYKPFDFMIYELKTPLKPGDSVKMSFKQSYTTQGFESSSANTSVVENGTFFNNTNFPTIGYNRKYELADNDERSAYDLPEREHRADRENVNELTKATSRGDADAINFEIIIGTDNDQTAISSGDLLKQWTENKRNYFHYKMSIPITNFYAIVSARYELKKDRWLSPTDSLATPVDLEIYYHKAHHYNLARMIASMKASLEYYHVNFSPYQYDQIRIMEFPRYAEFAQSFPGTIPFSEAIGFVLNIDDENDVDMAFFVTAHEIAHQWFGMQVEAANVKGRHFILETLSQYAALMVLKQNFSDDKIQQFIEEQEERYSLGKLKEAEEEPSLALVENQAYVYYAKGAIAMYKLQDAIGEDKVNLALKRFINDWNTKDGLLKIKTNRYATSKDLLGYFRTVAPQDSQNLITKLFESVSD